MSLKEQIPSGSPRNKIEFLADYIEQQIAEMSQGSEVAPENLLVNPTFEFIQSEFVGAMGGYSAGFWSFMHKSKSVVGDIGIGKSLTRPVPVGWGVEFRANSGEVQTDFNLRRNNFDTHKNNFTAPAFFQMSSGNSANFDLCLFSVFVAPASVYKSSISGEETFSAYFVGANENAGRFGIVELDFNGNAKKIVAQKTISNSGDPYLFSEDWIHGIKLKSNCMYAYFVESNSKGGSQYGFSSPVAAGVFLNHGQENKRPNFESKIKMQSLTRTSMVIAKPTLEELRVGTAVKLPALYMPFGIEKHLIACVTNADNTNQAPSDDLNGTSATITAIDTINVKHVYSGIGVTNLNVMVFYSETPLTIDFFNAV
ncbi:hypothetical protein LZU85_14090 [Vibrio sp. IRLE0018]|uniref:hypothetical protein n=1 Tax=Vibrio floridensis TaxID=2908007 RepID=UPI001F17E40F|nr:hypothetical protein [Vibrio floridensis]MCF8779932.1 hypothetical protein [Vibrio floridensis]